MMITVIFLWIENQSFFLIIGTIIWNGQIGLVVGDGYEVLVEGNSLVQPLPGVIQGVDSVNSCPILENPLHPSVFLKGISGDRWSSTFVNSSLKIGISVAILWYLTFN